MTKLVIFDLDGTLLDTLEDLAISTNHALAQNGFPQHDTEAYRFFVGNGITKLMGTGATRGPAQGKDSPPGTAGFRRLLFHAQFGLYQTLSGIPELIDDLQKQGLRMAVASNKYQAATGKLIDRYFPAGTFACRARQREEIPPNPIQRSSGTSLRKPVPRRQIPCMSEIAASICARQPIAGSGQ